VSWPSTIFSEQGFLPYGNCYLWDARVLNLHLISDALIAASYYSIPITLLYFIHRRRGIEFNWILACFSVLIIACGTTHVMEMWNIWHSNYWLSGGIKAVTAVASVPTAIMLGRWVPKALTLPSPADLGISNADLRREMETRKHVENALRQSQQMFQRLFENAPEAMILIDRTSRIVRANAQSLALFGLTADEIVERTLESLLPERCRAQHRAHLAIHFSAAPPRAAGGGVGVDLVGRRNDGTEFPADIMLSPLEMDTGPHVLAVIRDITERTRASEALAASEARYRNNFESLPVALFEVDFTEVLRLMHGARSQTAGDWPGWLAVHPEFVRAATSAARIVEVNPMALRLLGATSKEQIIASPSFQGAPEVVQHFAEDLAALERGEHFSAHESVAHKIDGTPIFILQTVAFPRPESRGRALFSAIDITKRKQAERERDQFFELSHDLFGIADFDGYFKRLNPAWEQTLGYSVAELVGTHFSALIDPDDLPATMVRHEQVQSNPGEHSFEIRYRAKDGSYRWMSSDAVSDPQHRLIYFTLRDITERRRTEDEIRRQNEQLETINRELEAFSYSISHDLRAPLRHIDGFANLLTRHAGPMLDATSQHYLGTISKSATKLGQLVDDLLDFSRIGRTTLRLEMVDNDALVADVIRESGYGDIGEIKWDIGALPRVSASKAMLHQVWANLIDNAVKYSRATPNPSIAIAGQTDSTAGEHRFSVRDNGVGFDMAYVDKLFAVFSRLHGPAEFEGTGIGLANVRRIVLRHGGRVWAEGRVGEGATFHFVLPVVPVIQHGSIPPFTHA
jgi:PAS domain S-box-containing protein